MGSIGRMVQWALFPLLLAPLGCDDITAGQPGESDTPPMLTRIVVQDARGLLGSPSPTTGFVQRNSVIDLLDTGPLQACNDVNPCNPQFNIDNTSPDVECVSGFCTDPLRAPKSGVPLSVPVLPADGDAGSGMEVRVVFDKLLNGSIEIVTSDPSKPPGMNLTYKLEDGLAELDDDTGTAVDSQNIYENGGATSFSRDLLIYPFGPAMVIKPVKPLHPATTYTVRLGNPRKLVDHEGRAAIGSNGQLLPAPYEIKFTTEALTANATASFPSFATKPTITPNEILQFAFWEPIDETTATLTVTGPAGVTALGYADRGGNAAACVANPWVLDFVNAPGGTPADWPAGDYTATLTVTDASGKSTYTSTSLAFTVAGTAAASDPEDRAAHPTGAQCTQ
jgi:hypothetical protein